MEPKWLIGGPESDDQVTQKAEQSTPMPESQSGKCPFCQEFISAGERHEHFGREMVDRLPGRYKGKTAAQWLAEAEPGSKMFCQLAARIAEHDGIMEFPALFNLVGALVPQAAWVRVRSTGRWVWRIGTGAEVAWFSPSTAASGARRRTNDAAKGYRIGLVRRRAEVRTMATASGANHFIAEVPNSPIEIVDDGSVGTQYRDR